MSDHDTLNPDPQPYDPQVIGMLAEFAGPDELVAAARAIREKGYRKVEAFSPFPIHGIDEALAAPKPILPWIVLVAGLTGCAVAVLMQWYMNGYEAPIPFSGYDYRISGKPSWSLPANIPVTFELVILFSAFTAFLGMIAFNALPRFSNPLFRNQRFLKATDDKFFLLVDSKDPQFAEETIASALGSIGAGHVEPLYDQPDQPLPGYLMPIGIVMAVAALVPLAMVAMARGGTSETPRLSIWWDMDYQPKYKSQTMVEPSIFADGRASRLPVEGTVSRTGLMRQDALHLGYRPEEAETFETALQQEEASEAEDPADEASPDEATGANEEADDASQPGEQSLGSESADAGAAATPGDAASQPAAAATAAYVYPWIEDFPDEIEINNQTMERGHQRYNIYCAICHGLAGDGDGLVALRAIELEQPTWRPPTSLHQPNIVAQPVGKIYDTITNGNLAGKNDRGGVMRGGMPGYKEQISLEDRWAIVLYVKALQKTRTASPDELTEQELASLK
jgi:mono/diheme cytochrome c family protein